MNRRANRTDSNHTEIMDALKRAGMKPLSLASLGKGAPDLAVGFRGLTAFLEVKDGAKPPSARKLTEDESRFHAEWPGHVAVVTSAEEAITAVLDHAKTMGRI